MQIVHSCHGLTAEGDDDISFAQSSALRGAAGFRGEHDDPGFFGQIVEADDAAVQGYGLRFHSNVRASNATLREEPASHEFCGVDADSKAKSLCFHNRCRVDADYFS